MDEQRANRLKPGIYRIHWVDPARGHPAVAAIGRDVCGDRWYAPASWRTVPSRQWSIVEHVELIEEAEVVLADRPLAFEDVDHSGDHGDRVF